MSAPRLERVPSARFASEATPRAEARIRFALYAALEAPLFHGGAGVPVPSCTRSCALQVKVKTNVKDSGQECPLYTFCDLRALRALEAPLFHGGACVPVAS
jgi:hypothetical protein